MARQRRHAGQRLRNVNGADNDTAEARIEDLDEDRPRFRINGRVAIFDESRTNGRQNFSADRQFSANISAFNKTLETTLEVRRECSRTPAPAYFEGAFEKGELHSTLSTKTWILPPQARPTSQARSLVTPKLKRRGWPSLIALMPSSMTAPSTQPPETEPMKPPPCSSASLAPTGRGEDPQVVTTVASATPLPAARQSAACWRISSLSPITFTPLRAKRRPPRGGAVPARLVS